MIRLPDKDLSEATLTALASYQQEVDGAGVYADQVTKAKAIWRNRSRNRPFDEVKSTLADMCWGPGRCGYCGDSAADEIEHIWPKDLYPQKTFVWSNYLYACGPCNGPKNNQFAIFPDAAPEQLTKLAHPETGPVQPPSGSSVLIDPRVEDPMQYLWLDVTGTFAFTPVEDDENTISWKRANYTINVLNLNSRDALIEARWLAYGRYRSRLFEYVTRMEDNGDEAQLQAIKEEIKREGHPTVWREMKRQQALIPELKALFDQAPQALNW